MLERIGTGGSWRFRIVVRLGIKSRNGRNPRGRLPLWRLSADALLPIYFFPGYDLSPPALLGALSETG